MAKNEEMETEWMKDVESMQLNTAIKYHDKIYERLGKKPVSVN